MARSGSTARDTFEDDGLAGQLVEIAQGWLDHLAVEKGASANTVSNYRRDLKRYVK